MARSAASPAGLASLGAALELVLMLQPGALQVHPRDAITEAAGPQQQLSVVTAPAQNLAD